MEEFIMQLKSKLFLKLMMSHNEPHNEPHAIKSNLCWGGGQHNSTSPAPNTSPKPLEVKTVITNYSVHFAPSKRKGQVV